MRFLFKRKHNDDSASKDIEGYSHDNLGIFSTSMDVEGPDPIHECKRLAELDAIFIHSKKLGSLDDVPSIVNHVRDGEIVLLDISRLNDGKDQTHLELKRIIERIRGETRSYCADIALINDGCIIVTPAFVRF